MKCVIRDRNTGEFVGRRKGWNRFSYEMVKDIGKARVFNSPSGALMSVGKERRTGEPSPYGRAVYKYFLPDNFEIVKIVMEAK